MEEQYTFIALAERYLAQDLSKEELKDFEAKLITDASFSAQFEDYRTSRKVVDAFAQQHIKDKWKKRFQEQPAQKRSLFQQPYMRAMAAVVLVLVVSLAAYRAFFATVAPDQLYGQYFELAPLSGTRSSALEEDARWAEAVALYNDKDYQQASEKMVSLLADSTYTNNGKARLYLGLCYMMTDRVDDAISEFEQVPKESASSQKAEWYRALALLKLERMDAAKEVLGQLADSLTHYKREDAGRILKRLW